MALTLSVTLLFVCMVMSQPRPPKILGATKMPEFITNSDGQGRDAGLSVQVGPAVIWLFGDTFTPGLLRSSTAGWANDPTKPWIIEEEVGPPTGHTPYQFYPFTPKEEAFNNAHDGDHITPCCKDQTGCVSPNFYCHCPKGTDCAQRVAHWPTSSYQINDTVALNFYGSLIVGWYSWDYTIIGKAAAWITRNRTIAQRVFIGENEPEYIFPGKYAGGPGEGPEVNGMLYMYTNDNGSFCNTNEYLSRVPKIHGTDRSAYEFWTGTSWSKNLIDMKPIGNFGSDGLGSIIWSDYLGAFLSFSLGICTGGVNGDFRTASAPQGPWSAPTRYNFSDVGAVEGSYAGELHPELSHGPNLIASFFVPGTFLNGEIHMVSVTLGK